jgi:hypothetical protein
VVAALALLVFVTFAVAGDRICGQNEEGIQGIYSPPLTCDFPEGATKL